MNKKKKKSERRVLDIIGEAMAAAFGISLDELKERGRVANAFPPHRRHWDVPWEAYVAVADLPEEDQDMLLDYHEAHGCFPGMSSGSLLH